MSDHQNLVDMAKRLIDKHGRDITIRRHTGAFTDALQPSLGKAAGFTDYVRKGVISTDIGKLLSNTRVREGDKVVWIAQKGLSIEIELSDQIIDGSVNYKIVEVEQIKPGEQSIIFKVVIRK